LIRVLKKIFKEWHGSFSEKKIKKYYTLKNAGLVLPNFGTNPNVGLKMQFKNVTQRLGLSIFDPKLGKTNPAFFRVNGSNMAKYGQTQMLD